MNSTYSLNPGDLHNQVKPDSFCSDLRNILNDVFGDEFVATLLLASDHRTNINLKIIRNLEDGQIELASLDINGPNETITLKAQKKSGGKEVYGIDLKANIESSLIKTLPDLRRPSTSSTFNNYGTFLGTQKNYVIAELYGQCSTNDQGRTWSHNFNYSNPELGEVDLKSLNLLILEIIARELGINFSSEKQCPISC